MPALQQLHRPRLGANQTQIALHIKVHAFELLRATHIEIIRKDGGQVSAASG